MTKLVTIHCEPSYLDEIKSLGLNWELSPTFGDNEIVSAIADNKNYFSRETLSEKLINEIPPTNAFSEEQIFDGLKVTLGIVRI